MFGDDTDVRTKLRDLTRHLDEFRSRQVIGGSSVRTYSNQTSSAYDFTGSTTGALNFTVTFTADRQDYAMTDLQYDVFIDGPSTAAALYTQYTTNVRRMTQNPATPRVTSWRVTIESGVSGSHTFYLKPRVLSTDTGTVS